MTAQINYGTHRFNSPANTYPDSLTDHETTGVGDRWELRYDLECSGDHPDETAFIIDESEIIVALAPGIDEGQYFFPRGASPLTGFFGIMKAGMVAGNKIPLRPVGFGGAELSLDGFETELEYINNREFRLWIRGRHKQAWGMFQRGARMRNEELLRKSDKRSYALDENTFPSIYNAEGKSLGVHVMVKKNRERIRYEHFFPMRLRWWNQDIDGEASTEQMTLTLTRGGVEVEELSETSDTKVTIQIERPAGMQLKTSLTRALMWADRSGNNDVWYEDLEFSEAEIIDRGVPGILDGMINSPSVAFNLTGSTYEASFTVPAGIVDRSLSYRIGVLAVIHTDADEFQKVQPLLKSASAGGLPEPCDLPMTAKVRNYDHELETHHIQYGAAADRYELELAMDITEYEVCAGAGMFNEHVSSVEVRLYHSVTGDPDNPDFSTNKYKNTNTNLFENNQWFDFNYSGGKLFVTFKHRAGVITNQSGSNFFDMAGETWIYEFRVRFNFSGFPQYTNIYHYKFKSTFNQYDNAFTEENRKIKAIYYFDADTGQPLYILCDITRVLVEVHLEDGHGSDGTNIKFRGMIDKSPYGSGPGLNGAMKEFDAYASPQSIYQYQQAPIEYADEFYDSAGIARMIINVEGFANSEARRLYAIQQPATL